MAQETSPIMDRTPPQNMELEMCVLGAIMIEPREAYEVAEDILTPEHFYLDGHALVFRLMGDLYNRGIPPDPTSVIDELRSRGELEKVGGSGVILGMLNSVPTAANIEYHAMKVAEKYQARRMLHEIYVSAEELYRQEHPVEEINGRTLERVSAVCDMGRSEDEVWVAQQMRKVWVDLSERSELYEQALANGETVNECCGYPTGINIFDRMTGGLEPGTLTIVAARPSVGKSALAMNWARHMSVKENIRAGFISLEMSKSELNYRLLSSGTYGSTSHDGISVPQLKSKRLSLRPEQWQLLTESYSRISHAPIQIVCPGGDFLDIKRHIRRMVCKDRLQVIFIDYLQLIGESSDNRNTDISNITRALKTLAQKLEVPIVLLSQLNRLSDRENRRPKLSDLRDSGAIEQDADIVVFIYRPTVAWEHVPGYDLPQGELIIAKQRNGPCGTVPVRYCPMVTLFVGEDVYS